MRLDRKETLQALGRIRGAISSRPGIPALTGVLVRADGYGWATLTATDLEVSVVVTLECSDGDSGDVMPAELLIPARPLEAAIKASKSAELVLRLAEDGKAVTIDGVHTLRLLPAEDFPGLAPGAESFDRFDAQELAEIIRRVAPAASRDQARPVLTGVLLELPGPGKGPATFAATDSYRMHVGEVGFNPATDAGWKAIVPARVLTAVAKAIGRKGSGSVGIGLPPIDGGPDYGPSFGDTVEIRWGSTVWTSRTIQGEFPNYRQLIPDRETADTVVRVDTAELQAAIKAAEPYGRDRYVKLETVHSGDFVVDQVAELSATSPDLGSFGPVRFGEVIGADVATGWNPYYLAGVVAATANGGASSLEIRNGLRPMVMRGAGVVALVMPVRLPAEVA